MAILGWVGGGLLVCKVEKQRFDVNMIEFCRRRFRIYFWGGGGMPGLKDGASYIYVRYVQNTLLA